MFILEIFIYLIGAVAIILTVLPFLKLGVWWVRLGDFPRLQIAFASLAVIVSIAIFFKPFDFFEIIFLISLIACAAYQIFCVLPYLPVYPKQVESRRDLSSEDLIKLLIFNVFIENRKSKKLVALIKSINPDLILLAEPNERWLSELVELEKDYPFQVIYPLENAYGMALYSRLKLENSQINFFIEKDIPSITAEVKTASGRKIKLFCLHPRPPFPTENSRSNERDAELLFVGRMIKDSNEPTIICGDLNDVAWSRTTKLFQKISGLLDPRIGRGLYSTFHANYSIIRFPLDHVFHSNHFRLAELKRLPNIGSDHFPIFIALNFEETAELTQDELSADKEEEKEAEETIKETLKLTKKENNAEK